MWHEAVWLLAGGSDNPSAGTPTSITGLVILTVPAFITALALLVSKLPRRGQRPQDEPPAPLPLPLPISPLNSDEASGALGTPERKRVGVLETWMWRHRFDPTKVTTGEESIDDVRIID